MTATVAFDNTTRMLAADLQLLDNQSYQPVQVSWRLPDPVTALLPAQVSVGFSAATGLGMELHQLLSWSFNSSLAPPTKGIVITKHLLKNMLLLAYTPFSHKWIKYGYKSMF